MEPVWQFLKDWERCIELDPFQHVATCLVGVACTLLFQLMWASVRGLW